MQTRSKARLLLSKQVDKSDSEEFDLSSDESDCDSEIEPLTKKTKTSMYMGVFMDINELMNMDIDTINNTSLMSMNYDSDDYFDDDDDEEEVSKETIQNIIESGKYSQKEKKFLNDLDEDDALYNVSEDKRLTALYKDVIPMKFKIVNADATDMQKALLLHKLSQIRDMGADEKARHMRWLDFALRLPLGKFMPLPIDNISDIRDIRLFLSNIRSKMDEKIYGHKETKEQILRILAQWISKPNSKGNVIGIYGEKGVGKSKLIKEGVSNALGLPFAFVPLGGVNDGGLLNGHHIVYEGASYGKIAEILMRTQTMNPVIFFDELDKVSKKYDMEIESVLTHLTDPVQNEKFHDNYFPEIDLDLSKSLLVFSYNDETRISPILRDRMITIHVSGYSTEDKVQICQKHLIEEVTTEFNIKRTDIIMSDDILKKIISRVDEEKGVRNLKRGIESIISSINIDRYMNTETTITFPLVITESHINKYIKHKKTSTPLLNMYI